MSDLYTTDRKHDSYLCWLNDGNHDPKGAMALADGTPVKCTCSCH